MIRAWIFLLILFLSSVGFSQSDFDESGSDFSSDSTDSSDDLKEKLEDNKKDDFKEDSSPSTTHGEVTRSDLENLSKAVKSKSEPSIVRVASGILGKDSSHLETLNALGMMYFDTHKLGLAKIIFRRALKDHPNEPALYNNLGIIYLTEGDPRQAIEFFKKSLNAKSRYSMGATNLSSIYLEYRDFKRSLGPLEDAYKSSRSDLRRGTGSSVEIANNYAVALMGVGEDSKASKVFEDILESSTRNPVPFLNYAILLVEVQKKKKDAIRVISKLKFMTEDRGILRQVEELERKME